MRRIFNKMHLDNDRNVLTGKSISETGKQGRLRSSFWLYPLSRSQECIPRMPRRPRADFYLHWVEDPKLRVRGWKIRVPYFDEGQLRYRRKLVSEFRYGGTKQSLRAVAIRLRDRLIAELGSSTFGVACFQRQKSSRNTSGHIGVSRNVQIKKGKMQIMWAARWTDAQGKIVMRRFSVRRHGEERAKSLAIMARADGIRHTAEVISKTLFFLQHRKSKAIKRDAPGRGNEPPNRRAEASPRCSFQRKRRR
jgi:hypothetical protein